MAFLNTSTPDLFGPEPNVEEEPFTYSFGAITVNTKRRRTVYTLRVTWAIDNLGGEVPPSTQSSGGNTYDLVSGRVERGCAKPNGHYTALYRYETSWVVLTP